MNAHTFARLLHMMHEYEPAMIAAEIEKAVR